MAIAIAKLHGAQWTLGWACAAALMLGACSPSEHAADIGNGEAAKAATVAPAEPRIVPIPAIPIALRGCWMLDDPDAREHQSELRITATEIIERASWRSETVVATAEFVQNVSERRIEGRFTASEGENRMTLATMLSLGPDNLDTPPGVLRLSEGDAGSRWYRRCTDEEQKAQ